MSSEENGRPLSAELLSHMQAFEAIAKQDSRFMEAMASIYDKINPHEPDGPGPGFTLYNAYCSYHGPIVATRSHAHFLYMKAKHEETAGPHAIKVWEEDI